MFCVYFGGVGERGWCDGVVEIKRNNKFKLSIFSKVRCVIALRPQLSITLVSLSHFVFILVTRSPSPDWMNGKSRVEQKTERMECKDAKATIKEKNKSEGNEWSEQMKCKKPARANGANECNTQSRTDDNNDDVKRHTQLKIRQMQHFIYNKEKHSFQHSFIIYCIFRHFKTWNFLMVHSRPCSES